MQADNLQGKAYQEGKRYEAEALRMMGKSSEAIQPLQDALEKTLVLPSQVSFLFVASISLNNLKPGNVEEESKGLRDSSELKANGYVRLTNIEYNTWLALINIMD